MEQKRIGGFHVTSSPPCWWTKTIDLSLAPFVRPPAFVHFTIVICVSRDWLKTTYRSQGFATTGTRNPVTKNKNIWMDSRNTFGNTSSKQPMSFENRFMILPKGFESKNRTGACKTATTIFS